MAETTMTTRPSAWAIPVMAILPLHLVGCDELFSDSDAGDADAGDTGFDSGGSDAGGTDTDDNRDSDDDRDAGGEEDSSATPDTADDDVDPVLPGNLRERLQPLLDRYCEEALDCGAFGSVQECEDYALAGLYEYIPDGADPSEGCINAVYSYFDCYTGRLECDESAIPPEVYSDANCDAQGTIVGLRCG